MEFYSIFIIVCSLLLVTSDSVFVKPRVPEEAHLNFTMIGRKYGFNVYEHDVITEDGYILKLFNLRGHGTRPVFLMHGIIDTADTFILRGPNSLAVTLARQGYDVWAGNWRGTLYSRRHVAFNPDADDRFWNFSFHEFGYYDVPALIDYTLARTGCRRLSAVAHSQGTTSFYVMGALRPEYNRKVDILISLAPVGSVVNIEPPLKHVVEILPYIDLNGDGEFFANSSPLRAFSNTLCSDIQATYELCLQELFINGGSDPEELEPEFAPILFGHYPASISKKNIKHTGQQGLRNDLSYFDYGPEINMLKYGTRKSPAYDLSKVTMKIALLVGRRDKIATVKDAKLLRTKLPNVVLFHVLRRKEANHMDFVWGRNMHQYLFPVILNTLREHMSFRL